MHVNVQQHGGDSGMEAGMAAAASEPGGPAAYFGRLFPWLLMPVWHAVEALGGARQQQVASGCGGTAAAWQPAAAAGGRQCAPKQHEQVPAPAPVMAEAAAAAVPPPPAAPVLVPGRITRLEQAYGLPGGKAGGLIPRLKALELLVNGEESTGTLPDRVAALEELSGL
jgi:hypothetical protein